MTLTILSILTGALTILLSISVFYNVKHGLILLKLQDSIEECLDLIDKKYYDFAKILEKPIFFDSVEVRQVVSDISDLRDMLLYVAGLMATIDEKSVEYDEEENS